MLYTERNYILTMMRHAAASAIEHSELNTDRVSREFHVDKLADDLMLVAESYIVGQTFTQMEND